MTTAAAHAIRENLFASRLKLRAAIRENLFRVSRFCIGEPDPAVPATRDGRSGRSAHLRATKRALI